MKQSVQSLMLLTSLAVGVAASAEPSAVDEEAFSELLLNSTNIMTEGFDYRAHGGANPYNMKNGTLQSTSAVRGGHFPLIQPTDSLFLSGSTIQSASCDGGPFASNALRLKDAGSTSVFSDFPEGTTLWGTRVCFLNPADMLEVSVVGGGGTLTFTARAESLSSFLAVRDSEGLSSVTIRNRGAEGSPASLYYFDEITTARAR